MIQNTAQVSESEGVDPKPVQLKAVDPKHELLFKMPSRFAVRMIFLILAVVWLGLVAVLWSNTANADDSEEYNFDWLDPDKKIYVLQNRKYTKANHAFLSGMLGTGFSNPYRNTFNVDPRFAYYFTETLGVEVFYTVINNSKSNTYKALSNAASNSGVLPLVREIKSQFGGLLHWSPWYAKINVFNQILYFDWYFTAGGGSIATDYFARVDQPSNHIKEDLFAWYLGTGHMFHVSQNVLVRWDITGSYYQALYDDRTTDKAWFSSYNFGIGLGLKL